MEKLKKNPLEKQIKKARNSSTQSKNKLLRMVKSNNVK